jgi:4-hydroxybenzoate polyprenyltransferase
MEEGTNTATVLAKGLGDTLWGRRGLVKTGSLWLPLLCVAFRASAGGPDAAACFLVFGAVACWSVGSVLVNDAADRRQDRDAGKRRWIAQLPAAQGVALVAALLGAGGLILARADAAAAAVYAAAVVISLAYSVEPVRLKRRGRWGLLAYGAACALAYVIVPWTFFRGDWLALTVLAPAVFLDKWVHLHFHQVLDADADRSSGVSTYATAVGPEQARRSLRRFAWLASLAMCAALAYAVHALSGQGRSAAVFGLGAALAAGVSACVGARLQIMDSALTRELPWIYLGLGYGVFRAAPAAGFLHDACRYPLAWETVLSLRYRRP